MGFFSKTEKWDAIIEEGHEHMVRLTRERDRAMTGNAQLAEENRVLRHRLRAVEGSVGPKVKDKALRDALRTAQAEAKRLQDELERVERERLLLERSLVREEERSAVVVDRHLARARAAEQEVERLGDRLKEAEDANHELRRQVAQLDGLVKGWAPLLLGDLAKAPSDHKQALRGQAALARARKTNLTPEARLRMLEEVERLGHLTPDLEAALASLRSR